MSSFWLSKRKGASTWIEPVDLRPGYRVRFEVRIGTAGPPPPTKVGRGGTFCCLVCQERIPEEHVKSEGMARRLGFQLMAAAVDTADGRRYLSPEDVGLPPAVERPVDAPEVDLSPDTRAFWTTLYGDRTYSDVCTWIPGRVGVN